MPELEDRLYFRQLLSGRDFAATNNVARQMVNFAYVIGDRANGEALLVDPAYAIDELLDVLATDEMRPVGVLGTHYHADHIGGDLMGHPIDGIAQLLDRVDVPIVHTPGHTPGSQCFLVEGRLVSGDTLFLEGCGRTDLPGSDPLAMYETLTTRLAKVPDETILYPGHLYSAAPSQSMGETRRDNWVLTPRTPEEWLAIFGH